MISPRVIVAHSVQELGVQVKLTTVLSLGTLAISRFRAVLPIHSHFPRIHSATTKTISWYG